MVILDKQIDHAFETFMTTLKNAAFALVLLSALSTAANLHAAANLVKIREIGNRFVFDPTNITINAGDSIRWTNTSGLNTHDSTHHPATGPVLWHSVLLSNKPPNNTFAFTFTNAGFYPYYCFFHAVTAPIPHPEQTGTVSVVATTIRLGSAQLLPGGGFQFRISGGSAGQTAIIDACASLPNWAPISTNTFPNTACPACP